MEESSERRERQLRSRKDKKWQDGLIDVNNEADQSQPSLWPIRIKLAGPWQKARAHSKGMKGEEERQGRDKRGEYSSD